MGEIAAQQATLDDIELLIDLSREGFPSTLTWDGPKFLSRNWWRVVLRSPFAEAWLFSINGEPSGLCVLLKDMNGWQAEPLYAEHSLTVRALAAVLCPKLVLSRLARLVRKVLTPGRLPFKCPRSESIVKAMGERTRIKLLAVAQNKRRQGVGRKILQFCENRTMELGFEIIELSVIIENTSARRLYMQQGYLCTDHKRDSCIFTKVLGTSQLLPIRAKTESL